MGHRTYVNQLKLVGSTDRQILNRITCSVREGFKTYSQNTDKEKTERAKGEMWET